MGSLQSLQGRVLPTSPSFWGSRRPSLGWWPPPSRLRLRLQVASLLCPCLSPSVSYKDPVPGLRATPTREDRHLRPFTPSQPQRPRFFKRSCSQVLGLGRRHAIYRATVQPLRDLSKGRPHSRQRGALFCFDCSCCSRKGREVIGADGPAPGLGPWRRLGTDAVCFSLY